MRDENLQTPRDEDPKKKKSRSNGSKNSKN